MKPISVLRNELQAIETELANCDGDDARHSKLMDDLCLARRNLNLATGFSPYRDHIPFPKPPRNDRIL